jgi:hypothetical protein
VAAALAIAVPVLVLAGGDGDGDAVVGADAPPGAWQTISQGGVRVEVPADWRKYTCDFDGFESDAYGPSEADACGFGSYLAFYASATFDAAHLPGVITAGTEDEPRWSGYVYADELAVSSATEDRDLTRRILASAQVDGQPDVEVAEWVTLDGVGMRVDVPDHWGVGPDADLSSYAVCAAPGDADDPPKIERRQGAEGAYVGLDHRGGRWVSVAAPTAAIGDLVLASVEAAPGSTAIGCIPQDFGPDDDRPPIRSTDE